MPDATRFVLAAGFAIVCALPGAALAQHACDELGERGWHTVPTVETVAQSDGKPYRADPAGSWYVDRSITVLPFCNYYNSLGNYSLRSSSLAPETRTERVEICRAGASSASVAVAPYAGRCPPG